MAAITNECYLIPFLWYQYVTTIFYKHTSTVICDTVMKIFFFTLLVRLQNVRCYCFYVL